MVSGRGRNDRQAAVIKYDFSAKRIMGSHKADRVLAASIQCRGIGSSTLDPAEKL